jgi:hypothetical protein
VAIENWGGQGTLKGRVRRIEPMSFTKVSTLGVEEQRVNVLVDIVSPPEQWRGLGDAYQVAPRRTRRLCRPGRCFGVAGAGTSLRWSQVEPKRALSHWCDDPAGLRRSPEVSPPETLSSFIQVTASHLEYGSTCAKI